jgi:hypothetical protein
MDYGAKRVYPDQGSGLQSLLGKGLSYFDYNFHNPLIVNAGWESSQCIGNFQKRYVSVRERSRNVRSIQVREFDRIDGANVLLFSRQLVAARIVVLKHAE